MPFDLSPQLVIAFGIVAFIVWFIYNYINQQYINFVMNHSQAIKELKEINAKYQFLTIPSFDMEHDYDNEVFYNNISPKDYLTYQLVYNQKNINAAIKGSFDNQKMHKIYIDRVNSCTFDKYDTKQLPKNRNKLISTEKKLFNSIIKKPTTNFNIMVSLTLTKINGRFVDSKYGKFDALEIIEIIERLNQKYNGFYLDNDIWQTICRVERGRVSNKMRFSIYERDGYRCKKCGRTDDLEVDHIFPISKGGKSTYDNLQTLCHRCNVIKSDTVEPRTSNPASTRHGVKLICTECGGHLVKRKGKYGYFYGCSNYPKCKFTMQLK